MILTFSMSGPLVVLLWKSRREWSCSGPSAGIARIDVIVQHMNYKCQPVALYLEQAINVSYIFIALSRDTPHSHICHI